MKDLRIVCAQPDDVYYTWQVHLWVESLKNIGLSNKATVLIFIPGYRQKNAKWEQVVNLYPEVEFIFYKDSTNEITNLITTYIPVLRPWLLSNYFKQYPERSKDAMFYCDSDVLFNDKFNIDKFVNDDVNYLSNTNSYISSDYFDGKVKDVLPERLKEYKSIDILKEATSIVGITREIAELNKENSGGAQYLIKNTDSDFWKKVMSDCISLKIYLQTINKQFFKNESSGFQSWCSDMWAVLWNIWLRGSETKVIPELDFAWGPEPISKLDKCSIYHNAGVTNENQGGYPSFFKGKYVSGVDPTEDPRLQVMLNNEETKKHCVWHYANELNKLKQKYNLNY